MVIQPSLFFVEMAGIEPASERIEPRISTSLVACLFRQVADNRQTAQLANRWDPKVPLSHG
jgi:hypothetical protein